MINRVKLIEDILLDYSVELLSWIDKENHDLKTLKFYEVIKFIEDHIKKRWSNGND